MAELVRGESTPVYLWLGKCECPGKVHDLISIPQLLDNDGKPHTGDWCRYRSRLFYGDWRKINVARAEDREQLLFLRALIDWNLIDENGEAKPLDGPNLDNLSVQQAGILVGTIDTVEYALSRTTAELDAEASGEADPNPPAGSGVSTLPASPITDPSDSGLEGTSPS